MIRWLRRLPWYLLLLAVFPTLALLGNNISEVNVGASSRALAFSLALAASLFLIFRAIVRDAHRAALAASLSLIIFFTYGHVYQLLRGWQGIGIVLGRHRYLLPIATSVLALGLWLVIKVVKNPGSLAVPLDVVTLALLITPAFQIISHEIGRRSAQAEVSQVVAEAPQFHLSVGEWAGPIDSFRPDIYYIILDAYGRSDVLEEYFGIDNSEFLDSLRRMGFQIADCSHSNYAITTLSLGSSLNMGYINDLFQGFGKPTYQALQQLAEHNLVRQTLQEFGYQVVSFESGYSITEWEDADYYFDLGPSPGWKLHGLSAFESMLADTTLLRVFQDWHGTLPFRLPYFLDFAYSQHRRHILNVLDHLAEVAEIPGPTFTMAHVLAPHDPFVFGPHGEQVTQHETFSLKPDIVRADKPEYTRGYSDQLMYVNYRILQVVESILEESSEPPIIIIQGDHGPKRNMSSNFARLANLNAYYLPEGGAARLYPSITPVNTFRLIFDYYFGADLPLLPDESYLSKNSAHFEFEPIFEEYPPCLDLKGK
jgi:hypothetical protein